MMQNFLLGVMVGLVHGFLWGELSSAVPVAILASIALDMRDIRLFFNRVLERLDDSTR